MKRLTIWCKMPGCVLRCCKQRQASGIAFRAPEAAKPLDIGLSALGMLLSSSAGRGSSPGQAAGGVGLPFCGMLILASLPSSAAQSATV